MTPRWLVRNWRGEFAAGEAIYRDVRGRRVLADAETYGVVRVASSTVPLWLADCDGERPLASEAVAAKPGFSVLAEQEGSVALEWQTSTEKLVAFAEGWRPSDGQHGLTRLATVDVGDLAVSGTTVQNLSEPGLLESLDEEGRPASGVVASHLNRMVVPLDLTDAAGLVLVKTYDRFHGRQRARVLVGGEELGVWYEPVQDRERRWAVGWFAARVPPKHRGPIALAIDPPPGTPLWSVSRMEISVWSD